MVVAGAGSGSSAPRLPAGAVLRSLAGHRDARGVVGEIFRQSWAGAVDAPQWTMSQSHPGVFRGVHLHNRHTDYLVILHGRASIGLRDLQLGASGGQGMVVELDGGDLSALTIPPGVAHGIYAHTSVVQVCATTHYWDPEDELGCHWLDPDLRIPWPVTHAVLSERDSGLPPLSGLIERVSAALP